MRLFRTGRLTDDQRLVLNVLTTPMLDRHIADRAGLQLDRVHTVLGQLAERRLVSASRSEPRRREAALWLWWELTHAGQKVAGR